MPPSAGPSSWRWSTSAERFRGEQQVHLRAPPAHTLTASPSSRTPTPGNPSTSRPGSTRMTAQLRCSPARRPITLCTTPPNRGTSSPFWPTPCVPWATCRCTSWAAPWSCWGRNTPGCWHRTGWNKRDIRSFLFEHARKPVSLLRRGGLPRATPSGASSGPSSSTPSDDSQRVPVVRRPEDINIMVAGGPGGPHSAYIPGWGSPPGDTENPTPLIQVAPIWRTTSMQRTESETDEHTHLARQLMEDARSEIAAGDTVQGGEKLWGAPSTRCGPTAPATTCPTASTLTADAPSSAWRNNSATRLCVWRSG